MEEISKEEYRRRKDSYLLKLVPVFHKTTIHRFEKGECVDMSVDFEVRFYSLVEPK